MDRWPLQLMVVSLAERCPSAGLVDQLQASRAAGVIQIIDAGIVHKGEEGELSLHQVSGIELDRRAYDGKLVGLLFGCGEPLAPGVWKGELACLTAGEPQLFGLTSDDLAEIADAIPRGSDVLVLLIHHRWNAGFAESVAQDHGVVLAEGSIIPGTLLELAAGSAAVDEPR